MNTARAVPTTVEIVAPVPMFGPDPAPVATLLHLSAVLVLHELVAHTNALVVMVTVVSL